MGALALSQGSQVASLGFCKLGSPAFARFDWLDHLAWPAVAHVLERCRVVAWMLRQVICVTSLVVLAQYEP